MKKRNILLTTAFVGALSLGACGKAELKPLAEQIEVELGSSLDENVTAYVALDEKAAKEATLDLSAVDTNKTGTYKASVAYKEQTAAFEVVVKDTTAPEVALVDKVTVAAGEPLHAKDVIAEVTELSGEVTAVFENAEPEMTEQTEGTEALQATEQPENTEALVTETELTTETPETEELAETFMVGAVTCIDDTTVFGSVGAYDVLLTVADASGNETEVKVSVIVGEAPEFSGIEDLTVVAGTESVDYLDGVTATDYKGVDITDQIICDAATVKLDTAGTYEILYTVADEEGFGAEGKASVTVTEKKAEKAGGKKTPEKNQVNAGNTSNPGGAANAGNDGNAGSAVNTGNTGTQNQSGGNAGAPSGGGNGGSAGTPSQPGSNAGASGNGGNAGTPSQPNGNTGNTDQNTGNTDQNTGNTDQNTGNTDQNTENTDQNAGNNGSTDNSGSTDAGNNGNTTPPAGSVTDPNTGMSVPGDIEIEDWGNMQGGADDGTDLGGSSTWH